MQRHLQFIAFHTLRRQFGLQISSGAEKQVRSGETFIVSGLTFNVITADFQSHTIAFIVIGINGGISAKIDRQRRQGLFNRC